MARSDCRFLCLRNSLTYLLTNVVQKTGALAAVGQKGVTLVHNFAVTVTLCSKVCNRRH